MSPVPVGQIFCRKLALCSLLTGLLLSACAGAPSTLSPQGPAAARIANLWWVLFGLGVAVWVFVMGVLFVALFRRRRDEATEHGALPGSPSAWIVGGGMVMPAIILIVIFALTLGALRAIAETKASDEIVIEVVGHQWWWEVRYPNHQFVTANEIHLPVGQAVMLRLTSADVIHSFWAPELHGKLDLNPVQT
ncbi:MAG: cytochrome c oxidase subunit II, partial [Anaerolineales bacterium]